MPSIAERLLRLLSLLNAGHNWRGEDLAGRMGVTPRTVRRDVDRLRDLGYEVHSIPGPAGGYRPGRRARRARRARRPARGVGQRSRSRG
jgi:predicted DNA-binding transcriptional regulator YafY